MVTREAGKPVNIVTLEPDRLDVCGQSSETCKNATLFSLRVILIRRHCHKQLTYICSNVGVCFMSQEKVHNGGVAILTSNEEWSSSSL